MTVDELARRAAGGDEDAFAQLVGLHEKKVYGLALRMCGNPEDAADAAQEAFLAAWKGLPRFRGEAGFSTWLYRLTSNAAIDHLRRVKRQRGEVSLDGGGPGLDAVDNAPSPQAQAEETELREAVAEGLSMLSEDHRQALLLRELRGLSYEEIASELRVDLGTVKSRISRARGSLRKILVKNGNLSGYLPSKEKEAKTEGRGRL
ncbi:MAG: sigma-70 family RNA polymerase sigma factor [Oscillospiraceae bacterium]|jgi:RNA polymerase sigma-70 factor (ECF subfamily)|nr:sigma-70 family RNA polymerase sigma factor [Oscillospiraceae bacterium]